MPPKKPKIRIQSYLGLSHFGSSFDDLTDDVSSTLGLQQSMVAVLEVAVQVGTTLDLNQSGYGLERLSTTLNLAHSIEVVEETLIQSTLVLSQDLSQDEAEHLITELNLRQQWLVKETFPCCSGNTIGFGQAQQLPLIRRVILKSGEPYFLNGAQIIGMHPLTRNCTRCLMTNGDQYDVMENANDLSNLFNEPP